MIPTVNAKIKTVKTVSQPSRTYKLDIENNRILGHTDGLEAVRQAFYKILNTERYAYLIYDRAYGVELERFIGKDYEFIVTDLERTITEALQQDDRFVGLKNVAVAKAGNDSMTISFTAITTAGELDYESEVSI